ncbi:17248_t:CDS:1, partial [Acaulospora colombiana]
KEIELIDSDRFEVGFCSTILVLTNDNVSANFVSEDRLRVRSQ